MSVNVFLNKVANLSYASKVSDFNKEFNNVKNYLCNYEEENISFDMTLFMCISMFAADSSLSTKETSFINESLGQNYEPDHLVEEYKNYKSLGYDKVFKYLKKAPKDVRKSAAIICACCLACDRAITDNEASNYNNLLTTLSLKIQTEEE